MMEEDHNQIMQRYLFAGYLSASFLLFQNPTLLWGHKQISNKKVLNIAHRGGSRLYPENTITAFNQALKDGADAIEMDVHLTKDKRIVVHHDQSIKRTCGVDRLIKDLNYQQLPCLQQRIKVHFHKSWQTRTKNQKIPLLQQVFKEFPTVQMNIEVKSQDQQSIERVGNLIQEFKKQDIVIWGVNCHLNNSIHAKFPKARLFANKYDYVKVYIAYLTGLLPFVPVHFNSFQVPMPTTDFQDHALQMVRTDHKKLKEVSLRFMALRLMWKISKPLIIHLKKRGIQTYVWVLNRNNQFEESISKQVCGIMTDDPKLLSLFLQKKQNQKRDYQIR